MALPKLYDRIVFHNDTEPALNEDNLNAMSKGLDDVDDRLIALAGTIMEDVPQIVEDMEILGPAVQQIETNVERSETAADNAEASALKSEGYAIGEQDGVEVGPDSEYYQNNAKYYAEIANPPIQNTVDFTDIITVTDAINKAAKDVKLKVEAVQDLHGYNNPWVGGAGKNKLPFDIATIKAKNTSETWNGNVYVYRGITFTIQTDEDNNVIGIKLNGTSNDSLMFELGTMSLSGNYVVNMENPWPVDNTYLSLRNKTGTTVSVDIYGTTWAERTFSANGDVRAYVWINNGISFSNYLLKPMVSTSGGTFEPYENICPISGWDNAKVTRARKNLFDNVKAVSGYYLKEDGTTNASGSWNISNYIKVSGSIVMSTSALSSGNAPSICWYDKNKNFLGGEKYSNRNTVAVSLPFNAVYVRISFYNDWVNITQLELGTTPTTFEPYQGDFYLIELDGTRYGGTLDVTSGVLTIDRAIAIVDGDVYDLHYGGAFDTGIVEGRIYFSDKKPGYTNFITNEFEVYQYGNNPTVYGQAKGSPNISNIWFTLPSTIISKSDLVTWLASNPIQIVYELATPTTVQLTPTQVYLLYGYNTLFGDCGDISLTYDASGIIHIEEAKLDTETLKTIAAASSDFADFKARIAAL